MGTSALNASSSLISKNPKLVMLFSLAGLIIVAALVIIFIFCLINLLRRKTPPLTKIKIIGWIQIISPSPAFLLALFSSKLVPATIAFLGILLGIGILLKNKVVRTIALVLYGACFFMGIAGLVVVIVGRIAVALTGKTANDIITYKAIASFSEYIIIFGIFWQTLLNKEVREKFIKKTEQPTIL